GPRVTHDRVTELHLPHPLHVLLRLAQAVYPRDLHSFPTRRSSDLDTYVRDGDGYFWYQARSDDMIITSGYNVAGPEVEQALMGQDRKSTRLNSSHVKISYAVFCLKKKTASRSASSASMPLIAQSMR